MRRILLNTSIDLWLEVCIIWLKQDKNIANVVSIKEGFPVDPKELDYVVVKRIFKYLKGTLDFGLWYDRSNDFTLYAYTSVDWASSMDDRKSTIVGTFFLKGRLVFWLSKK